MTASSPPSLDSPRAPIALHWHKHLPPRVQRALAWLASVMDGAVVLLIIVIATLVTIFLDDIKVSSFTPNSDIIFSTITFVFLGLFLLELLLNCICKPSYFPGWYFVLDCVSAFSLLPDIPLLWNPIIGLSSSDTEFSENTDATTEVERIKRVSHTGSRLLKVLKFVKLIRLGRIAKLFEMAQRTLKDRSRNKRIQQRNEEDSASNTIHADDYTESSQVGQSLSEQTIRNVVLLVLVMLFGIPLLQPTTEDHSQRFLVNQLQNLSEDIGSMGNVFASISEEGQWVVYNASNGSIPVIPGIQIHILNGSALQSFFPESYESTKAQQFSLGNKQVFSSPEFNTTYIRTLVTPNVYPVVLQGLTQCRTILDKQFTWSLSYYNSSVLYLRIRGRFYANDFQAGGLFLLRTGEMSAEVSGNMGSVGVFSQRSHATQAAIYSMLRTSVTLFILLIGALFFDKNNRTMVIAPIERMVATIVQLQKNPLAKAVIDQSDQLHDGGRGGEQIGSNETQMLERTLQKLTGLLQVGFGDAGSRMIQKCMSENSGDLDPLVDGTKMLAVFGFCDIRRFTDATECLREDVMMYVNEIASIVHEHVWKQEGHPNKNVGDAFLLMWRLSPVNNNEAGGGAGSFEPEDLFQINENQAQYLRPSLETLRKRTNIQSQAEKDYMLDQVNKEQELLLFQRTKQAACSYPPLLGRQVSPLVLTQLSIIADKALVSFVRIIVDLDASVELRAYENHPRITQSFSDFRVVLGFGLHCGWAIEGPIGSRYKIDASYLSPHVNLSESLQDLTKIYGTPLLVSGEFYTLLSPYLKAHMRRIDVVKVTGRDLPMNLYAFDINKAAMASIIALKTPMEYDLGAEIDAVELKNSLFQRFKGTNGVEAPSPASPTFIDEPLSPQSPHDPYADPLSTHELFTNPSLNPTKMDFSNFHYSGADREIIQAMGPVGKYHMLDPWNYRLSVLQAGIPFAFHDRYEEGLELYLEGDWPAAKLKMDECLVLYPEDVPTTVILGVMNEHDFVAPSSWAGWHEA